MITMNTTERDITPRVMRMVYMIWLFRKVANPFVLKCAGLAYAVGSLGMYVSVPDVWHNTWRLKVTESPLYLSQAYLHTEFFTQILVAAAAFTGGWLLYDTTRRGIRKSGMRLLPFTFSRSSQP